MICSTPLLRYAHVSSRSAVRGGMFAKSMSVVDAEEAIVVVDEKNGWGKRRRMGF
jgi:hypothetical protein